MSGDAVSGDVVSGDVVSGDVVSGDVVSGDVVSGDVVSGYEIRPLDPDTWDAFVALCDRHGGGGFGGCYCTWFHRASHSAPKADGRQPSAERTRLYKQDRVENGTAHAALVFDGETAVGWAQYGSVDELPGISHRKDVAAAGEDWAVWRITCVFVDRSYRRRGVARVAIDGALSLIAAAGGGAVESYPQDTAGRKISASFLYNATRTVFEDAGFTYVCAKGKNHCIVRTTVPSS